MIQTVKLKNSQSFPVYDQMKVADFYAFSSHYIHIMYNLSLELRFIILLHTWHCTLVYCHVNNYFKYNLAVWLARPPTYMYYAY